MTDPTAYFISSRIFSPNEISHGDLRVGIRLTRILDGPLSPNSDDSDRLQSDRTPLVTHHNIAIPFHKPSSIADCHTSILGSLESPDIPPSICRIIADSWAPIAERLSHCRDSGFVMHFDVEMVCGFTTERKQSDEVRLGTDGLGRPEEELKEIEKSNITWRVESIKESDLPAVEECSICLQKLSCDEIIAEMPCCHYFHTLCIATWMQRNPSCPVCRGPIQCFI